MEFVSVALSVLISLLSPGGFAIDRVVEDAIRSQVSSLESLEVRVDNTPSWQVVQGKISQVRIAAAGVYPMPELRIDQVNIETDPIDVDIRGVRQGQVRLDEPFQAGVQVVMTEADLNRWIQSPQVLERVRNFGINLLPTPQAIQAQRYALINPQVEFQADRLRATVSIQDLETLEQLDLQVESGLEIEQGRSLVLIEPMLLVNGEPAPPQFVDALATGINRRLDLRTIGAGEITVRVIDVEIDADQADVALFVRVDPVALAALSSGMATR